MKQEYKVRNLEKMLESLINYRNSQFSEEKFERANVLVYQGILKYHNLTGRWYQHRRRKRA